MAGWASLRATREDFGSHVAHLQGILDAGKLYPNVSDIRDIELTAAKRAMYADVTAARYTDTSSDIDTLVDSQAVFFQQTLALKQMAIYFQRMEKGEESADYRSWKFYDYEYEQRRKQFATLTTTKRTGATVRSMRIGL